MLVQRQNVRDGMTEIGSSDGRALGSFTLQEPGDAVLLRRTGASCMASRKFMLLIRLSNPIAMFLS